MQMTTVLKGLSMMQNKNLVRHGKNEFHVDPLVRTLPKFSARDNTDSNLIKLDKDFSLVSLKAEESWKSLQIQHDKTNKLTKQVDLLQENLSQTKVKYEEIKQSKIYLIAELDHVKTEHKDEVCQLLLKPGKKKKTNGKKLE